MAVQQLQVGYPSDATQADILVSRQPIVDGNMRVTGYRIAYVVDDTRHLVVAPDETSNGLLGDLLTAMGLEDLVGSSVAHLTVSADLLLTVGRPPVRSDRVILRIAHETANDARLAQVLEALASSGYGLSLYDVPGCGLNRSLLDVFSVVEVDFSVWDEFDATSVVPQIISADGAPLASGLLNHSDFEMAKAQGFQLFTGPFFASPRVTSARQVPAGEIGPLATLARLHGDAPIEELEALIDHDLGLSVKLLRYINSAFFSMRSEIGSIRQAVMMLGPREISRWALLIALAGGPTTPRELSVIALTRARMCELLGAKAANVATDELFTIGLLSVADALLDMPLETIVSQLPLTDDVAQALLWRAGPAGQILHATDAFERGDFDAEGLAPYRRAAPLAYRQALRWARETVSTLV